MRRSWIATMAAVFAIGCTEVPSAPLLEPVAASFETSEPPPPWAVASGSISTEYGEISFSAGLFINKPGNVAWLQFHTVSSVDGTATATKNARIMSLNGKVSGVGTISVGGNTIYLNEVTTFTYSTYRTTKTVSFSGGSILRGTASTGKVGGDEGSCTSACYEDGISSGGR